MPICCGVPAACSCGGAPSTAGFLTYAARFFVSASKDCRLSYRFGTGCVVPFLPSVSSGHRDGRSQPFAKWYLWTVCILVLIASTMARPSWSRSYTSVKPRWINPCDLPCHVFDPDTDMEGAPAISLNELYSGIKDRSRVATEHANHVKELFLKHNFNDPDFVTGTQSHGYSWLPKIPTSRGEYFRGISTEAALLKSFEILQYFAVGIEQIILDQMNNDGSFVSKFREVENHLTQVLCEIQLGIFNLKIQTSPVVLRNVMSHEYRNISSMSRRNVRDYLILRDYVKATHYVYELFAQLERTLRRKK